MNTKIIGRTIDFARAMCPLNLEHRCSHVSFLILKGKIVHIGTNSVRTHPENLKYNYHNNGAVGLHAELAVCIKSRKEDLSNYSMVVLRVDRTGQLNNSKPCRGCENVIKQFNINDVWYSNNKGDVVKL